MNGTTHQMELSSTNASAVINSALGNLTVGRTWQEKVVLMGNFTIDSALRVYSHTNIELRCNIYLADNSDCNIFENAEWNATDVTFSGCGYLYGNYQNQASGHGIYWRINGTNSDSESFPHSLTIAPEELRIHLTKVDGVHANFSGCSGTFIFQMRNTRIWGARDNGLYCNVVSDAKISDCYLMGATKNAYFRYCSGLKVSSTYFSGGCGEEVCLLENCQNMMLSEGRYDNGAIHFIRLIGYTKNCVFDGGIISSTSIAGFDNNTYSTIRLEDTCAHNKFDNFRVYNRTSNNQFKYAFEEIESVDFSTVSNFDAYNTILGIVFVGANSKVSDSWNSTTWIN